MEENDVRVLEYARNPRRKLPVLGVVLVGVGLTVAVLARTYTRRPAPPPPPAPRWFEVPGRTKDGVTVTVIVFGTNTPKEHLAVQRVIASHTTLELIKDRPPFPLPLQSKHFDKMPDDVMRLLRPDLYPANP